MLRISKLTDYALVLLAGMADRSERDAQSAPALARRLGIPEATVAKVMKTLVRAGFIHSARGVHGGYRLARPPAELSVAAVIEAFEGPIAITECGNATAFELCERQQQCTLKGNWQRVNAVLRSALEELTLEQMIAPNRELLPGAQLAARSRRKHSHRGTLGSHALPDAAIKLGAQGEQPLCQA